MTSIFLIRHANSVFYEENSSMSAEFVTRALTKTGLYQARRIAKKLKSYPIQHILSSPYKRTMETAKIIAKNHPINIEIRDDLREQDRGPLLSTIKSSDIKYLYPTEWQGWQSGNPEYTPPGGESTTSFLSRVENFLAEMDTKSGLVVVITHFGFIQGAVCLVLGLPFRFELPLDIAETAITHIRSENGKLSLVTLNDNCHSLDISPDHQ